MWVCYNLELWAFEERPMWVFIDWPHSVLNLSILVYKVFQIQRSSGPLKRKCFIAWLCQFVNLQPWQRVRVMEEWHGGGSFGSSEDWFSQRKALAKVDWDCFARIADKHIPSLECACAVLGPLIKNARLHRQNYISFLSGTFCQLCFWPVSSKTVSQHIEQSYVFYKWCFLCDCTALSPYF